MERDTVGSRPPLWVFGLLFVAYLVAHVALLLSVYAIAPSTPFLVAEMVAVAGGAVAVWVTLLVWRRSARA